MMKNYYPENIKYEERTYRELVNTNDLLKFSVSVKETDLLIMAEKDLSKEVMSSILKYRNQIEKYIEEYPVFKTTLEPYKPDNFAPNIVQNMSKICSQVGVGPMASVAGAVSEFVGLDILPLSPEFIIENGGDIFFNSKKIRTVGIYAGRSPLSNKIAIEIQPHSTPLGICTSSGTVGHSLSFGKADAVVIISGSAILADAAATAVGNIVKTQDDILTGIEEAKKISGLLGVVIIKDDKMGCWGEVKLVPWSYTKNT
ncbi:MAG: UPF0280 family protein [bacterium]|nr:UPF0280 family protein [bacterium]